MVITSTDNAKVKEVVKLLTSKKYRKKTGRYVIEGARLVAGAFEFYPAIVSSVFVSESKQDNFDYDNQIVVSDNVFAKMSDTVNSQGILAVVAKRREDFSEIRYNTLILDGLQDPGNVGTLLRTAVACDFLDIYAINCVDLYSPKVVRSAMSAHLWLNIHERECGDKEEMEELIKDLFFAELCGYEILACDMNGENIFERNFRGVRVAVVLGNEGNGLSEYSKSYAEANVSLPMWHDVESLNVAVAGSVIMYHVANFFLEKFK